VNQRPRVFVFTYDRYDSINTSLLLEQDGVDHVVLCHTEEQREQFVDHGRVRPDRLIVTGEPRGLANNRNVALEMMADGEWAMFLVDDLKRVTELDTYDTTPDYEVLPIDMANQNAWRSKFRKQIDMNTFLRRAVDSLAHAEAKGAHLLGFAGIDNAVFRRKKWKYNALADGRAWMVQKTDLRFDLGAQLIDDLCWTAQNIERFGITVNNEWILPDCRRYTKGGFGSIEDRMEQKLREAAYLVEAYPRTITFKKKTGWPDGAHVVLRTKR